MNQLRSVKKIIKKNTNKYVSLVMKKSVKVMQRTVIINNELLWKNFPASPFSKRTVFQQISS